ncbi:MAG: 23S rRNA (adenine(2503)-C(2))-methyltransferase RlmN [Oscillospiraceae bacterium]
MTQKKDILSLSGEELLKEIEALGERSFRAKQIFKWLHRVGVTDFSLMQDLSLPLRSKLEESFYITKLLELRRQTSSDGTIKFLFQLEDGNTLESVLMTHSYGSSLCVSTQVGCRMGCKFCASTLGSKVRDLTAGEILSQVYTASALTGRKIDKLVLMGMGEPLDNYNNVMKFLKIINDENGLNMSHRHISLSTCGIVPRIYKLADEDLQLTLSISLHAANNEERSRIMPVNNAFNIEELMGAARYYFKKTHRRISYEYALIEGVNDSLKNAEELAALLKGQGCHINLIPVNPVKETGFLKTNREQTERFREALIKAGFSATVRKEMGGEIDAACGQLRQRAGEEDNLRKGEN